MFFKSKEFNSFKYNEREREYIRMSFVTITKYTYMRARVCVHTHVCTYVSVILIFKSLQEMELDINYFSYTKIHTIGYNIQNISVCISS